MSLIGFVLLLAALFYGRTVSESPALAAFFNFRGDTLALMIIGYGFCASVSRSGCSLHRGTTFRPSSRSGLFSCLLSVSSWCDRT